jgi:hypothetical protein
MNQPVYDEPSDVDAVDGVVLVSGPGGVVASFTPDAAADTSDRLLQAAAQAEGQTIEMRSKSGR